MTPDTRLIPLALFLFAAAGNALAQSPHAHDEAEHTHTPADTTAPRWAEKTIRGLRYREIVATLPSDSLPLAPPYLGGFAALDPDGAVGSVLVGSYLGAGDKHRHPLLFAKTRVAYRVLAGEGARDLALAVAIPWPESPGGDPESLLVTLTLVLDGRDTLAMPVPLRPGRTFFGAGGEGTQYSAPTILVFDLPPGERRVVAGLNAGPGRFGFVTAGVPGKVPG